VTKPITDIDDPRLVKALAHPLRVRIMGVLEKRAASPKDLAEELGVPLENVSYHVRALKDFGFIKQERQRIVRGTVQRHYRAVARPRITAAAWEQLPDIVREALDRATIDQIMHVVAKAANEGKLWRPESHLDRFPLMFDEQGFAEASQAITEVVGRLQEIEKASKARLSDHDAEVPSVFIAMLFDAPSDVPVRAPAKRRKRAPARADSV
jgi:DNA-binding transcriptional ArsR family regulator